MEGKKVVREDDKPTAGEPVELGSKPKRGCVVKVLKLQEVNGDFKSSDIVTPVKLTKSEKALMLPKKSGGISKIKKEKPAKQSKVKGKKKSAKFQLKISEKKKEIEGDEDDESDVDIEERKRTASGDSIDRPDSGFSSRADTPAVWSDNGSKAGSPLKNEDESELGEDMEKEKEKFLKELDEGLSSEDESESDWDGDSDGGFGESCQKT